MRISCPDATGLGCDIARLLLDFGLRIMDGELVLPPWRLPAQDAIFCHACAHGMSPPSLSACNPLTSSWAASTGC